MTWCVFCWYYDHAVERASNAQCVFCWYSEHAVEMTLELQVFLVALTLIWLYIHVYCLQPQSKQLKRDRLFYLVLHFILWYHKITDKIWNGKRLPETHRSCRRYVKEAVTQQANIGIMSFYIARQFIETTKRNGKTQVGFYLRKDKITPFYRLPEIFWGLLWLLR